MFRAAHALQRVTLSPQSLEVDNRTGVASPVGRDRHRIAQLSSAAMAVHEPLLGDNTSRMSKLGSRLGLKRALVVVLILLGGLLLSLLLPTNKTLPCPWCKISSFIGWLYFLAWSIRWELWQA